MLTRTDVPMPRTLSIETNQFIFSCSSNSGDLTAQIFDENLEPVGTVMTIFDGDSASGASIIYSYDLGNYYVISDVSSNNEDSKKFISFPSGTVTSIFVERFGILPKTIPTTIPTTSCKIQQWCITSPTEWITVNMWHFF